MAFLSAFAPSHGRFSVQARWGRRAAVSRWGLRLSIRAMLRLYLLALRSARRIGRQPRPASPEGYETLVTLKFYSEGWASAMLRPLALSPLSSRVWVVSTSPVPAIEKVQAVYPPRWLRRIAGDVVARLLTFALLAVRRRPHWVAGYHLLFNGLVAGLVAPLAGCRSLYISVGGPAEVLDGGIGSENQLFKRLGDPDPVAERLLLQAMRHFDVIATMGRGTIRFLQERGVDATFRVVPGGIDAELFSDTSDERDIDVVLLGRLSPIKRPDLFLRALRHVADAHPGLRAAVVGTGPLRESLGQLVDGLGLGNHVELAGFQPDVTVWLRRSKIFVLTSESEGLSLSLMEAMLCATVPVVANVGELGDLVEHGVGGYLVSGRTPEAFATPLLELLGSPDRLAAFAREARRAALRYEVHAVARLWDDLLTIGEATRSTRG